MCKSGGGQSPGMSRIGLRSLGLDHAQPYSITSLGMASRFKLATVNAINAHNIRPLLRRSRQHALRGVLSQAMKVA